MGGSAELREPGEPVLPCRMGATCWVRPESPGVEGQPRHLSWFSAFALGRMEAAGECERSSSCSRAVPALEAPPSPVPGDCPRRSTSQGKFLPAGDPETQCPWGLQPCLNIPGPVNRFLHGSQAMGIQPAPHSTRGLRDSHCKRKIRAGETRAHLTKCLPPKHQDKTLIP